MARSKPAKPGCTSTSPTATCGRRSRRAIARVRPTSCMELARQDRLIRPGMTVVDLGAAPGGWSQVAAELAGPKGRVIAVDILDMPPLPGVTFIHGDFREEATLRALEAALAGQPVDLVVSDMAPNISGIGMVDQARAVAPGRAGPGVCGQVPETGREFPGQSVSGRGLQRAASAVAAAFPPGADAQARGFAQPQQRNVPAGQGLDSQAGARLGRSLTGRGNGLQCSLPALQSTARVKGDLEQL